MYTNVDISGSILINCINRAGLRTLPAAQTQFLIDDDTTTPAERKRPCRTGICARGGGTRQTPIGDKPRGKTSGGVNTNTGTIP